MSTEGLNVYETSELAAAFECAETTIEEAARAGLLPGIKLGRAWRFPAGALARRLDELALEQAQLRREGKEPAAIGHAPPDEKKPPRLPKLPGI
jgi:hypothetical protein